MNHKNKILPSIFDAELWQLHYEQTQEPTLILLSDLSRDYLRLKDDYTKAPQHLKKSMYARLKRLETQIKAIDESYKQGRDYVGSLVVSLFIEFKRMCAEKDMQVDEMHQSYKFMAETAIMISGRNNSSHLKRA
jgi:hypothetical protein